MPMTVTDVQIYWWPGSANCLVAKIYHKIGNGIVKSIDTSKAEALDGVVKWLLLKTYRIIVILRRDIPGLWSWLIRCCRPQYPYRKSPLLRRWYCCCSGRRWNHSPERALRLIEVEYEEYPVEIHPRKSMYEAKPIHLDKKDNVLVRSNYFIGNVEEGLKESETVIKRSYKTPIVQHYHWESDFCAYMEMAGS